MKKNFLFLMILVLGVALTGCGGGGDATDAPVAGAPVFMAVNFQGQVQNGGVAVAAAPSRQLTASALTAELVNVENGVALTGVACTAGGNYSLGYTFTTPVRTKIRIRSGAAVVAARYLGLVQPVSTTAIVTGVTVDDTTSAQSALVEQSGDATLLDTPYVPVTTAGLTTTVDSTLTSLATANAGVATIINTLKTAIQTALTTAATNGTISTTAIPTISATDITTIQTAVASLPKISSITLDGLTVYENGTPTTVATSNLTPTFVVNFNQVLSGSQAYAMFYVTETSATGTVISHEINSSRWGDYFTGTGFSNFSGSSLTFSVKSKAEGGKLELARNCTYKIEVHYIYGLSTTGSPAYMLYVPMGLAGYFTTN